MKREDMVVQDQGEQAVIGNELVRKLFSVNAGCARESKERNLVDAFALTLRFGVHCINPFFLNTPNISSTLLQNASLSPCFDFHEARRLSNATKSSSSASEHADKGFEHYAWQDHLRGRYSWSHIPAERPCEGKQCHCSYSHRRLRLFRSVFVVVPLSGSTDRYFQRRPAWGGSVIGRCAISLCTPH